MDFYVICDDDSKHESMTKEQILEAITQAISTGKIGDCDTGFITKIKEQNGGKCVTFWVGTQAQYNALAEKAENCMYIITDDTSAADLLKAASEAATTADNARAEAVQAADDAKIAWSDAVSEAESAAASAEIAKAAAEKVVAIDITDKVTLSWAASFSDGKKLTYLAAHPNKFVWIPTMRMVFFNFNMCYNGTAAKGERIVFSHIGKYRPSNMMNGGTYPATSRKGCFSAEYCEGADLNVWVYVNEAISRTDGTLDSCDFAGWYFCDGE